jgi:DNA repair exonuclease SbcCD ATPase subunit
MAIHFKQVKWKNFLSTGDAFTEINLNTGDSTLIVGANGAGKSTLLDALSFALFGKPHREINKPQLVNSVNAKNCEVEVDVGQDERHGSRLVRRW